MQQCFYPESVLGVQAVRYFSSLALIGNNSDLSKSKILSCLNDPNFIEFSDLLVLMPPSLQQAEPVLVKAVEILARYPIHNCKIAKIRQDLEGNEDLLLLVINKLCVKCLIVMAQQKSNWHFQEICASNTILAEAKKGPDELIDFVLELVESKCSLIKIIIDEGSQLLVLHKIREVDFGWSQDELLDLKQRIHRWETSSCNTA